MILNRGNRENVIVDKSALNDVEELNETLARIKNAGEYLGEFSFTVVLYGWGDKAQLQRGATDVTKVVGNHEAALIRETYNALNAYLSIIPGNQAFNLRRTWLLSSNYADLSFLYAPYDLGGSYRQITQKHDGSYLHMQFGEGRQPFRINPFILPSTPENLQFLFTFVRLLLTNAGYAPSVEDDRELYEGIEALYVLPAEQRTLRNLVYGLPPHLAPVLRPWIADGQYGSVFDNSEDTLTFSHFQAFDFQGMDELYPQVLEPLLFYIFQRISQVVYDPCRILIKPICAPRRFGFAATSSIVAALARNSRS